MYTGINKAIYEKEELKIHQAIFIVIDSNVFPKSKLKNKSKV